MPSVDLDTFVTHTRTHAHTHRFTLQRQLIFCILEQIFGDGKNMRAMWPGGAVGEREREGEHRKTTGPTVHPFVVTCFGTIQHVGTKLWPFIVDFLVVTVVVRACVCASVCVNSLTVSACCVSLSLPLCTAQLGYNSKMHRTNR